MKVLHYSSDKQLHWEQKKRSSLWKPFVVAFSLHFVAFFVFPIQGFRTPSLSQRPTAIVSTPTFSEILVSATPPKEPSWEFSLPLPSSLFTLPSLPLCPASSPWIEESPSLDMPLSRWIGQEMEKKHPSDSWEVPEFVIVGRGAFSSGTLQTSASVERSTLTDLHEQIRCVYEIRFDNTGHPFWFHPLEVPPLSGREQRKLEALLSSLSFHRDEQNSEGSGPIEIIWTPNGGKNG